MYIALGLFVFVLLVFAVSAKPLVRWLRQREVAEAMQQFRSRREQLEAKFFDLASTLGKPRDVRWTTCDWQPEVSFARDRESGLITAFASVNVSFEAIAGGDMEDVEHVGLLRDGCALFHYQDGQWGTGGRVVFNMNPRDAIARFATQYEEVVA
ncbi:MAG: hypothetical protein R3B90_02125 [Planctomycetaceae bacterium]